jgi:hypothetical protein
MKTKWKTMKIKSIIFLIPLSLVLVGLLFKNSLASADYDESVFIQKTCGLSGVPCSNKVFESNQIKRFSDKVFRNDRELQLKIASGSPVILRNTTVKSEKRRAYWFLTYYQQTQYYLVHVRGWEGFGYLMISTSAGNIIPFIDIPIISKDLKRCVVTSLDLEAGYRPNRITIFRFVDEGVKKEWSKNYTTSGPSHAAWLDHTIIAFFETTTINGGQSFSKKRVTVQLGKDGWKIMTKENAAVPK